MQDVWWVFLFVGCFFLTLLDIQCVHSWDDILLQNADSKNIF